MFLTPQLSVPVNVNSMVVSQAVVNALAIGAISVHIGALPSVRLTLVEQVVLLFAASVKIHVTVLSPLLNLMFLVRLEPTSSVAAILVVPSTPHLIFVTAQLSVPVNVNEIVVSQALYNDLLIAAIGVQTGLAPSVRLTVVEHV